MELGDRSSLGTLWPLVLKGLILLTVAVALGRAWEGSLPGAADTACHPSTLHTSTHTPSQEEVWADLYLKPSQSKDLCDWVRTVYLRGKFGPSEPQFSRVVWPSWSQIPRAPLSPTHLAALPQAQNSPVQAGFPCWSRGKWARSRKPGRQSN